MPPPSISANVIAAMELKFPNDEEKKNSVCNVLTPPQMPEDFFSNMYTDNVTNGAVMATLGFRWERQRRSSVLYHVQVFDLIKLIYKMGKKKELLMKKLELLMEKN